MRLLIQSLLNALFGARRTNQIVSSIRADIEELRQNASYHFQAAAAHRAAADAAQDEANHAKSVADKFDELIS